MAKLAELDDSEPLIKNLASERAIHTIKKISPEDFHQTYREKNMPVIIRGIVSQWPAAQKWKDPHYFSENFGKSHVPIEVGGHYLATHWTQKLVTFKDFIEKYITLENKCVFWRCISTCRSLRCRTSGSAEHPNCILIIFLHF